MRPPLLSPEEIAALHAEYQSGATLAALARKRGCTANGLNCMFRRQGLPLRPRGHPCASVTDDQIRALHAEYVGGAAIDLLAFRHDRSAGWLRGRFRALNLALRATVRTLNNSSTADNADNADKTRTQSLPSIPIHSHPRLKIPAPSPRELAWRDLRAGMDLKPAPELLQGLSR